MKTPRDMALGLLLKAEHDLKAGKAILAINEAFDMVCFHAQQTAEKCLKALLASKNIQHPLRHDIGELIVLAGKDFPALLEIEEKLVALSPYAVEMRYDFTLNPDFKEASLALKTAEELYNITRKIICGHV